MSVQAQAPRLLHDPQNEILPRPQGVSHSQGARDLRLELLLAVVDAHCGSTVSISREHALIRLDWETDHCFKTISNPWCTPTIGRMAV